MNTKFKSRLGLVDNLKHQLLKGHWAIMTGGPMIGKTTLLNDLYEQLQTSDTAYRALKLTLPPLKIGDDFWPELMDVLLKQGISAETKNPYRKAPQSLSKLMSQLHHIYEKVSKTVYDRKLILLIDNAEALLPHADALIPQIVNMVMESLAPAIEAVCWVGGMDWNDWVQEHPKSFIFPLRHYPLSVVPIREARQIITERLRASEVENIWHQCGGHPFLLEQIFMGEKNSQNLEDLNKRLQQMLSPGDQALLNQLNEDCAWKELSALEGDPTSLKKKLDRLCMLGVVVRTLDQGTAVVRRTSVCFDILQK